MELLKAKLYQETAVYRIPFSLEIVESYPLPTPCTVNGMIHSLLGADSLIPGLSFSIQGSHNGIMEDYQWYRRLRRPQVELTVRQNGLWLLMSSMELRLQYT